MPKIQTSLFKNVAIDDSTGCWNWTAARTALGYGQVWFNGKVIYVHRLTAHLYLGMDLSSDICALHRCDNPSCCNPNHLFLGTKKQNSKDMVAKGRRYDPQSIKTHCPQGHPYDADNTYVRESGERNCRECARQRARRKSQCQRKPQQSALAL